MEKYGKEIEVELQQAVEKGKLNRGETVEKMRNEQQGRGMEHKL